MRRTFFLIIVFVCSINLFGQIDYGQIEYQKLTPMKIDTISDSILVVNNRYATIYFSQSDVKRYIESDKRPVYLRKDNYSNLTDILSKGIKKIVLTDWWYTYGDSDRLKLFGNINYTNDERRYFDELYCIGADLIHDGKFMITKRNSSKIITKNLVMRRIEGQFGTEYIAFQLPSKQNFWLIVTAYGE